LLFYYKNALRVQFIIPSITSRDVIRLVTIGLRMFRFLIGGPLQPYAYLEPLWRYGASTILWSRPWPFAGHVMSSVTWPFDTPCGVSYRWSMVTMHLPCTVSEI